VTAERSTKKRDVGSKEDTSSKMTQLGKLSELTHPDPNKHFLLGWGGLFIQSRKRDLPYAQENQKSGPRVFQVQRSSDKAKKESKGGVHAQKGKPGNKNH